MEERKLEEVVESLKKRILELEKSLEDLKSREKELEEAEKIYKVAVEHSNDGVAMIGGSKHLYVNRRFVQIFEYESPEEIIGKPVTFVVHPDDFNLVKSISERRMRGDEVPERYEFKGLTKTGKIIYLEVSAASASFKGEPVYLVFLRDVTERKESEKLLTEEKERLNTLLENAPIGIALVDEKGVFRYVNPKFTEIFGYESREVPDGRTFLRKLFPDQSYRRKVISDWIDNVKTKQVGQRFPRIFTIHTKDGKKKIVNFIPVRLATGEHIITFEDITERIEAEEALRQSKEQLERLNVLKSKAIDHISHELKTPASVLLGSLRILKRKLSEMNITRSFEKILGAMERNVSRILEISKETDEIFRSQAELESVSLTMEMEDLLIRLERMVEVPESIKFHWKAIREWLLKTFSEEKEDNEDIELFSFLENTLERIRGKIGARRVHLRLIGEKGLAIRINPKVLQSTIEGIIKNAIENTPDGGYVEVFTEKRDERVLVHIKDTGVGITEENLPHLFDGLFHTEATDLYRSKKPYEFGAGGKGLELFTIKRYALKYGFEISVKSKRCVHLPTERDLCPGDVKLCKYLSDPEECKEKGGTTFTLSFVLPNP